MDREKVIKQLEKCINDTSCHGCPYGELIVCRHYMIADALELLKEQEARIEQLNRFVNGFSRDTVPVVRCKDCKWYDERISLCDNCGLPREQTFFCADGERKDSD